MPEIRGEKRLYSIYSLLIQLSRSVRRSSGNNNTAMQTSFPPPTPAPATPYSVPPPQIVLPRAQGSELRC